MKKKRLGLPVKILFLISLSISLMVVDSRSTSLSQVRSFLSVLSLPFHLAASSPILFYRWVGGDLNDWGALRRKYGELKEEVLILKSRVQQLDALQYENNRLREIVTAAERIPDEALFGRVIEVGLDLYDHTVLVNRGTADGVYVGQTVLDPNGVIGQIVRTGLLQSSVMLVTDQSLGIPVQLVRTGLRTILYGSGQDDLLTAPFLERTVDVLKGDIFVTSGLAGRYPAGYPVGRVINISRDSNAAFLNVIVKPVAALKSIREVLLIWHGAHKSRSSDVLKTRESSD